MIPKQRTELPAGLMRSLAAHGHRHQATFRAVLMAFALLPAHHVYSTERIMSREPAPFVLDAYETPWYLSTISPKAVHRQGVTYIAYQGSRRNPFVMSYRHLDSSWSGPVRSGTTQIAEGDSHGNPAIYLDSSDRVHLLYGGHGKYGPMLHSVSSQPECIESGFLHDQGGIERRATYPALARLVTGEFTYLYRAGEHHNDWVLATSRNGWAFDAPVAVLEADSNESWYATGEIGPNDNYYIAFGFHHENQLHSTEPNHSHLRENVYLIRRSPSGDWYNVVGDNISNYLPISKTEADRWALVWSSRNRSNPAVPTDHSRFDDPGLSGIFAMNPRLSFGLQGEPLLITTRGRFQEKMQGRYETVFIRWDRAKREFSEPTVVSDQVGYFAGGSVVYDNGTNLEAFVSINHRQVEGLWGGDLAQYESFDEGKTWKMRRILAAADANGLLFEGPVLVQGADHDAYLLFFGRDPAPAENDTKLFLYGSRGFVGRNDLMDMKQLTGKRSE